jgi:hypothetical protein
VVQRLTKVAGVRRGSEAAKSRSGKTMVARDRACRGGKCARFPPVLGDLGHRHRWSLRPCKQTRVSEIWAMLRCSSRPKREGEEDSRVTATFSFAGVGLPGNLERSAGFLGTARCR